MRAGKTEWAHALAGGLSVRGAEGSFAGLTANVPEAVDLSESIKIANLKSSITR